MLSDDVQSSQKERLESVDGAGHPRVLPFGIVMRSLEEHDRSMGFEKQHTDGEGAQHTVSASVRLSPVEQANLHLINDPALQGYDESDATGAAGMDAADRGRQDGAGVPASSLSLAAEDSDPTLLGRIEDDVICVGADIKRIGAGPDGPRAFVRVEVDPANRLFSTDGIALYSADGKSLIRLVVAVEDYEVREGCEKIADRAFDSVSDLRSVTLPHTLRYIGRLAFAKTGLLQVELPSSVRQVEEKAFYGCSKLERCTVSEGLSSLGDEAFARTGLKSVHLPATLTHLGREAFRGTPAERRGDQGAISISSHNGVYEIDEDGGLYAAGDLYELLSVVPVYAVRPGCGRILDNALRRDIYLKELVLPETVHSIGANAFRGCKNLWRVELPEGLESIGPGAFMNTNVRHVYLGPFVNSIGEEALVISGENPKGRAPLLQSLALAPENPQFYLADGVLCERGAGNNGADKAITYVGPSPVVHIPEAVNQLAPYAFFGAVDVDELHVHDHMQSFARGSLTFGRAPRVVVMEGRPDIEGKGPVSFPLPSLTLRYRDITDLFATAEGRTIFRYAYYDAWVTHCGKTEEFLKGALVRLRNPVAMSEDTYELYRSMFLRKERIVCACCAAQGDLEALEFLQEAGLMSQATINEVLQEAVGEQDARATACLLEASRRQGAPKGLDLSI